MTIPEKIADTALVEAALDVALARRLPSVIVAARSDFDTALAAWFAITNRIDNAVRRGWIDSSGASVRAKSLYMVLLQQIGIPLATMLLIAEHDLRAARGEGAFFHREAIVRSVREHMPAA